jgi:hypothetical protein
VIPSPRHDRPSHGDGCVDHAPCRSKTEDGEILLALDTVLVLQI